MELFCYMMQLRPDSLFVKLAGGRVHGTVGNHAIAKSPPHRPIRHSAATD